MIDDSPASSASMSHVRLGSGRPLLLLHGLGGSWRSWEPILYRLAAERDVIAVDLPGFGATPPLAGDISIATLADAVTEFLREQKLLGVDVAGSSMGARLALELARRRVVGTTVALAPGGFWQGWERQFFGWSIAASYRLVRALRPALPLLTANAFTRSLLLAQFSARPWDVGGAIALRELRSFASSPAFAPLLEQLVNGPPPQGLAEPARPILIVWGRQDRVCFPDQARHALDLFPNAKLTWFDSCGHFPHWDQPHRTANLILTATE